MNVERTRLVDHRSFPNTRPARWNQTTSKIRAAAPDAQNTAASHRSAGTPNMTWSRCLTGRVCGKRPNLTHAVRTPELDGGRYAVAGRAGPSPGRGRAV